MMHETFGSEDSSSGSGKMQVIAPSRSVGYMSYFGYSGLTASGRVLVHQSPVAAGGWLHRVIAAAVQEDRLVAFEFA